MLTASGGALGAGGAGHAVSQGSLRVCIYTLSRMQVDADMFFMPAVEPSMFTASGGALGARGAGHAVDQGISAMRGADLDAALN